MAFFEIYKNEIIVFVLSMLPISEIRGSVIFGAAAGMDPVFVYILSVIGNFLPVPFILWLFRPILKFLRRFKIMKRFANWLERHAHRKAGKLMKVGAVALYVFVAIPLPTTGAWTGSMIASLFDMRFKYAIPAILCGIVSSGIIMTLLVTGVLNLGALNRLFLK